MEEGKLIFSTFELYLGKILFEKNHMENFIQKMPYVHIVDIDGIKCLKINIKFESRRQGFLLMSVHEGKFLPLSPTVFNKITCEEHPNQRKNVEAEWNSQFYAVYDFEMKILYISNVTKKSLFESIIVDHIFLNSDIDVYISNIYKSPEDFMAAISKPKRISFARRTMNQASLLEENSIFDPKWADGSDSFFVELQYKNKGAFFAKMCEFLNLSKKNNIKRLICIGTDDNDFEKIYRVDSFIEKIPIDITRNQNGLYEDAIVFDKLVKTLSQ